jgi:hypothetical protein
LTIVTRKRSSNFAIIPNEVAEDARLSFDARGLLCYLLAKPHDWKVNVMDIQREGKIGRDKAYNLIRELRETGYIEVDEQRDARGQIMGRNYIVYDCAIVSMLPLPENPDVVKPLPEKPELAGPLPENPDSGFTASGKHGRINKNPENTKTHSPPTPTHRFAELTAAWFQKHLPAQLAYAERLFAELSADDQAIAIATATTFCAIQTKRNRTAKMIEFLKQREFRELDGAPPVDRDGDFIITPDRPEWRAWLADTKARAGDRGVEHMRSHGRWLVKTRWPAGYERQLTLVGVAA